MSEETEPQEETQEPAPEEQVEAKEEEQEPEEEFPEDEEPPKPKVKGDERLHLIRKAIAENTVIIGTRDAIKGIEAGKVKRVFVSSNCPAAVLDELAQYQKLQGIEVTTLKQTNEELGVVCKKPFSIALLGLVG